MILGYQMRLTGKMSTFGGPLDLGVSDTEGLALIQESDLKRWWFGHLFLADAPLDYKTAKTIPGLARRLNPRAHYIACRWDYQATPKDMLRNSICRVSCGDKVAFARPVDWGPHLSTGRVADFSPGLADALYLKFDDNKELPTDSVIDVALYCGSAI